MAAALVKTATPGIYSRGDRYVVVFRDTDGRQRKQSARTLDEARKLKARVTTAVDDGSYRAPTRFTVADHARAWAGSHVGSRGKFTPETRAEYLRDFDRYLIPFMGHRRLTDVRRRDVKDWIAWLTDDQAQAERHRLENVARLERGEKALRAPGPLRDKTVRRIVREAQSCFAGALEDELRADNPFAGITLPSRDGDDGEGIVKALTREELAWVVDLVKPEWRVLIRLLAATGLRIGEALALDVSHLHLDGARPRVEVRQALRNGRLKEPKSRHGRRDVPIPRELADDLRRHVNALPEPPADVLAKWGRLAFPSGSGRPMSDSNLRDRVLAPATKEAGVEWASFHAFRHTFASMNIERGANVVRLSRLLGHHSATVTLDVYSHMLDDGYGEPLDLDAELDRGRQKRERPPTPAVLAPA